VYDIGFRSPETSMVDLLARAVQGDTDDKLDRLRDNLRRLRLERNLTLETLSAKCGVSRAMISKIERGTSVPTATILGKLAAGLEIGLSQLLGGQKTRAPMMLMPVEQALFRDPESGLERRSLSPLFPDRHVDFALNTLPPRSEVSFPGHHEGVEEYLYVSRGALVIVVDKKRYELERGFSMFYSAEVVHEFHNETDFVAEFFIVVDSSAAR
jgi:transcriptional regulator with XRE-family HTH domain